MVGTSRRSFRYEESREFDGVYHDPASVVGVISDGVVDGTGLVWVSAFNPQVLLEMARLAAFCYGRNGSVDVGFIPHDTMEISPLIVVGDMDADRWVSAAPRDDTDADAVNLEVFGDD